VDFKQLCENAYSHNNVIYLNERFLTLQSSECRMFDKDQTI